MLTYSRNEIENYRIAEKQEQKILYEVFLCVDFQVAPENSTLV